MPDGVVEPQDMSGGNIVTRLLDRVEIADGTNVDEFRLEGEWRYSQAKVLEFVAAGEEIVISKVPFRPNYICRSGKAKKCKNLLSIAGYRMATYEDATEEIRDLFGRDVMDYPKPSKLIRFLVEAITSPGDLVMDFFAGSGSPLRRSSTRTTNRAANVDFRLVQSPEPTQDPDYRTIADICKERVRRVLARHRKAAEGKLAFGKDEVDPGVGVFQLVRGSSLVVS